jgi:hypothetical protein
MMRLPIALMVAGYAMFAAGCSKTGHDHSATKPVATEQVLPETPEDAEIRETRAKLSPEDRALVEAQEWCVVNDDDRLGGSMGPPVKLTIKGQPVFICCKGCRAEAEANPDKTLAKLEELKAKKKAEGKPQ